MCIRDRRTRAQRHAHPCTLAQHASVQTLEAHTYMGRCRQSCALMTKQASAFARPRAQTAHLACGLGHLRDAAHHSNFRLKP
eukprot:1630487-Alexandrium_andersonii.AAC.1